jgi:hypothetical protein
MNEQAKQNSMLEHTKNRNPADGVQTMIARVMSLARLLATENPAPDDDVTERSFRQKHKHANL